MVKHMRCRALHSLVCSMQCLTTACSQHCMLSAQHAVSQQVEAHSCSAKRVLIPALLALCRRTRATLPGWDPCQSLRANMGSLLSLSQQSSDEPQEHRLPHRIEWALAPCQLPLGQRQARLKGARRRLGLWMVEGHGASQDHQLIPTRQNSSATTSSSCS